MSQQQPETWRLIELRVGLEARDDLSGILWELGTIGFQEEEDPDGLRIRAYFAMDSETTLIPRLRRSAEARGLPLEECSERLVEFRSDDWLRSFREGFQPLSLDPTFHIHPPWTSPSSKHPINIRLEPSHAFGTGTHESTQLCLMRLEDLAKEASSLLDVGTGSGILSLAAAKLNPALSVVALDNDPRTSQVARDLFLDNGVSGIHLLSGEVTSVQGRFELVTANLTLEILRSIADGLIARTGKPLLTSGFTSDQASQVLEIFQGMASWRTVERRDLKGWCCLVFEIADGEVDPQAAAD